MGEVYLVQHPRLPRQDALKLLPSELTSDGTYRARFIREADLASGLDHPSIVSVYDRGEDRGQLWITMKYVPGADANEILKESGPFSPADTVDVVTAVADALDYAHGKGLLHRDVKPANILIDPTTATRRKVYLTDFGIARTVGNDTALTAANLTVGSIQYTSPEQLRGADLNGRSDQYSLACTAFRLLTGRAPYPERLPAEIINAHLNNPIPHARSLRPELPATVDAVLARAMDKQAVNRYPTCMDFARDLKAALSSAGPSAAGGYQPTMINPGSVGVPAQPPAAPIPMAKQPDPAPYTKPYTQHGAPAAPGYPQPHMPQPTPQAYGQQQPYGQAQYPQQFGQPPQYPGGRPGQTSGGGGKPTAVIVGAIVVVVALVAGLVIWLVTRGGDDSSTTAASSSASSSTTSSTTSSTAVDPAVVAGVPTQCSTGQTTHNTVTTRLTSGKIEIPTTAMPSGWSSDRGSQFPFVTDADGVYKSVDANWVAQIAVGTLPSAFATDTEAIARKFLECLTVSSGYRSVTVSTPTGTVVEPHELEKSNTKVSLLTSDIPVTGAPAGIRGDSIILAVVNSSPMTIAIGISPIGDTATQTTVRNAVQGLLASR